MVINFITSEVLNFRIGPWALDIHLRHIYKLILIENKIEKENTQNCQIKSFGLRHKSLLRSFA